jgi:hypothetical protein
MIAAALRLASRNVMECDMCKWMIALLALAATVTASRASIGRQRRQLAAGPADGLHRKFLPACGAIECG